MTKKRKASPTGQPPIIVERTQTGVRMEKGILKVLKALAEYFDMSLGDLLEGIVLHAFDGKCPFGPPTRRQIATLKGIYGLKLDSTASHRLVERGESRAKLPAKSKTSRGPRSKA